MNIVLDIDAVSLLMKYVGGIGSPSDAVNGCAAVRDPFTGDELARLLTGAPPGAALRDMRGLLATIPVSEALTRRGAILVDGYGRCGFTVGRGRVVQPAGRVYALTDSSPSWWVTAWWPTRMVVTV